jgi:predicted HicB family RNase H-like nuclease
MPKGKKDIIKAHAESRGESVNEFINKAIDQRIEAEHN